MTVEKGDVFGEETDEISMIVVTEVGEEGFRLAERFYNDDGVVDWRHYWCPPDEFDERPTVEASGSTVGLLEAALDCVESQDIGKTEEIHGIR